MSLKCLYLIENLFFFMQCVCIYFSQVAQMVKNLPAGIQETWVQSVGWEDSLEKGMAPTPVFLPGESHGQRSLGGLQRGGRHILHSLGCLIWDILDISL